MIELSIRINHILKFLHTFANVMILAFITNKISEFSHFDKRIVIINLQCFYFKATI